MINNQIEAYILQVHFFNLLVKFSPLQNFQGITIDIQYSICFDLGVTTLNIRFLWVYFSIEFVRSASFSVETPDFFVPLFLYNLNNIAIILRFEVLVHIIDHNGIQYLMESICFGHWAKCGLVFGLRSVRRIYHRTRFHTFQLKAIFRVLPVWKFNVIDHFWRLQLVTVI